MDGILKVTPAALRAKSGEFDHVHAGSYAVLFPGSDGSIGSRDCHDFL